MCAYKLYLHTYLLTYVIWQLYDAFDTFGVENSEEDSDNEDLFYTDAASSPPRRRHRTARPLGDMAYRPSTSLWAGWNMGQADDGRASSRPASTTFDAEHPMRKYRRRKKKRNGGRRSGRNNRIGKGRTLTVTTTTTTAATPATQSNQVMPWFYVQLSHATR